MKSMIGNRGQALVETLFSLPLLVAGVTLVMVGLHSLSVFYLVDYWTYSASRCLAEERLASRCRQTLERRLQSLPYASVQIQSFRAGTFGARVETRLTTVVFHDKEFSDSFATNLTSSDFGAAR